jgi:hypothetical protein
MLSFLLTTAVIFFGYNFTARHTPRESLRYGFFAALALIIERLLVTALVDSWGWHIVITCLAQAALCLLLFPVMSLLADSFWVLIYMPVSFLILWLGPGILADAVSS